MAQRYKFSIESKRLPPSLSGEPKYVVAICVVFVVYGREEGVTLTVEELLGYIGVSPKNSRDNLLLGYFLTVYQPRFACRLFHWGFASVIDCL